MGRIERVALRYIHSCMLSSFSHVQLFAILWTVTHQAPLSMGLSRQEHWSGLPRAPPDLPDPEIEPWQVSWVSCMAGGFFATCTTWECIQSILYKLILFMNPPPKSCHSPSSFLWWLRHHRVSTYLASHATAPPHWPSAIFVHAGHSCRASVSASPSAWGIPFLSLRDELLLIQQVST